MMCQVDHGNTLSLETFWVQLSEHFFSPAGKKVGNAQILQAALKGLTSWFPSSYLNKCVCFCAGGYCGNDLAVRVAASHCGSNQELWGAGVYLDVVE